MGNVLVHRKIYVSHQGHINLSYLPQKKNEDRLPELSCLIILLHKTNC